MADFIRILLIEDNPGDVRLIREYLKVAPEHKFELHAAHTFKEGRELLQSIEVDIVLLDLHLPDSFGLDTFTRLYEEFPAYPYIVLTGMRDESLGLIAVAKGAQDYLEKGDLDPNGALLTKTIRYGINRHKFETEKQRVLERLERAQQLARVGDWEIDPNTNEFSCSSQVYQIFELGDEVRFRTFEDYLFAIDPRDQEKVARELWHVFKHSGNFSTEHQILFDNGRVKYIALQGQAYHENGNLKRLLGTVQDITDRKKIEQLTRDKELAQKAFKVRQEFLAKTSHEIRTPLNPILGLTDILLRRTQPTDEQREYLNAIKTAGDTLLAVVNDILDLSKIEAGKIDFNRESFSLNKLFSSLKEMMEINAKDKLLRLKQKDNEDRSLKLKFELDPEIPSVLIGDSVRLSQILLNLVGNAIKFTDEGEIRITSKLLKRDDSKVSLHFVVEDTGIGIPEDKLSIIFESFKQVDGGMSRRYGGVGLGLTIVKQLVMLQGGEITVESNLGEGSRFSFDLGFELDVEGEAPVEIPVENNRELEGMRILLVEDNETNQIVTQNILASWGIESDIANNGLECLELVRQRDYDLILMDIQMPEMDGYEATRHIRSDMPEPKRNITIIALTANAFSGIDDKCLQVGMNDYISKPVRNDSLFAKILQYAKGHNQRPETPRVEKQLVLEKVGVSQPTGVVKQNESSISIMALPGPPYTDLTYLKSTVKDAHIVKRAVKKFIETTPALLNKMDKNLEIQDYDQLEKCAHKLKSSLDNMGMSSIKSTVLSIERKAKQKEGLEILPSEVAWVRQAVEEAFSELETKIDAL